MTPSPLRRRRDMCLRAYRASLVDQGFAWLGAEIGLFVDIRHPISERYFKPLRDELAMCCAPRRSPASSFGAPRRSRLPDMAGTYGGRSAHDRKALSDEAGSRGLLRLLHIGGLRSMARKGHCARPHSRNQPVGPEGPRCGPRPRQRPCDILGDGTIALPALETRECGLGRNRSN